MRRAASLLASRALAAAASQSKQGCNILPAALAASVPTANVASAGLRSIWVSTPSLSTSLLNILKDELKHEETTYVKPDVIARGPPAPFTLAEVPGDTMLTLTRSFEGGEQIKVDLHINNQPSADEEANEDGETLTTVLFNVHITKKEHSLVFECQSDGTYVLINHVSHEPKDSEPKESTYTGPVYDELDETLQREFRTYLEARGITSDLGEYLRHLVHDKEVREYRGWLARVRDFVEAK